MCVAMFTVSLIAGFIINKWVEKPLIQISKMMVKKKRSNLWDQRRYWWSGQSVSRRVYLPRPKQTGLVEGLKFLSSSSVKEPSKIVSCADVIIHLLEDWHCNLCHTKHGVWLALRLRKYLSFKLTHKLSWTQLYYIFSVSRRVLSFSWLSRRHIIFSCRVRLSITSGLSPDFGLCAEGLGNKESIKESWNSEVPLNSWRVWVRLKWPTKKL